MCEYFKKVESKETRRSVFVVKKIHSVWAIWGDLDFDLKNLETPLSESETGWSSISVRETEKEGKRGDKIVCFQPTRLW